MYYVFFQVAEYLVTTQQLDIYGVASAYEGPVRVIHGTRDSIVPMWCGEKFVETYGSRSQLVVVEGENHTITRKRKEAGPVDVLLAADTILSDNEAAFLERRALLTPKQWKFLRAVAKEGEVYEPTGAAFLQKYDLGAPSTAVRLLKALTEKELLLETKSLEGSSYCVYNVFFSRWLERL